MKIELFSLLGALCLTNLAMAYQLRVINQTPNQLGVEWQTQEGQYSGVLESGSAYNLGDIYKINDFSLQLSGQEQYPRSPYATNILLSNAKAILLQAKEKASTMRRNVTISVEVEPSGPSAKIL